MMKLALYSVPISDSQGETNPLPFLYIQFPAFPTMNFYQSFPPADDLISHLRRIDYIKHLNSFMDAVENLCVLVAAFYTVCAQQWRKHHVTERLQILAAFVTAGAAILWAFLRESAWPIVKQMSQNVWRILYTIAQPPLTV